MESELSKSHKGKRLSDSHKKHISEGNKGRVVSIETRKKISIALTGIKRTKYTREKISQSSQGRIPWNKGLTKYTYEQYREAQNKYQKQYRIGIGKLKSKIFKIQRKHLEKQFKHSFTLEEWNKKINKTKGICPMCGKYVGVNKLTLDHIVPLTKAQKRFEYTIDDVQPLCNKCNSKKGNRKWKNYEK